MKKTIHDKNLPHLRQALNGELMANAFEALFRRDYPERELQVQHCRVGRVYHKPGKDCGIMYRVSCRDREQRVHENWFYGKMFANGKVHSTSGKKHPATWPGCGFWKPVSLWRETEMILHAFPYDSYLPHLGRLLEPEFIKQQVEENLSGFGLPDGSRCLEVACEKIKYMPNKRCVLRYELRVRDPQGRERQLVFYSKTYDNAKSRYVFEVLRELCRHPKCNHGALNIPHPIAHIDEANTLWQHAWAGEDFRAAVKRCGWENLASSGYLSAMAAMLATLHQIELRQARLQAGPTFEMVLENARSDVFDLSGFLPEQAGALQRILDKLARTAATFTEPLPRVTMHGTFKLAQLLCREQQDHNPERQLPCRSGQLALIDFDSIACGDPLYDVAELVASLAYLHVSEDLALNIARHNVESFLQLYESQVPWPCERARHSWYVVTFLLGKMHSSLKRLEKKTEELAPAFELLYSWLDG